MPQGAFSHFLNFLYLTDIVIGVYLLTLLSSNLGRLPNKLRRPYLYFNLAFFVYLIWNYIDFYRTKIIAAPELNKALFILGDISFVALFLTWTFLAAAIVEARGRWLKLITAASLTFLVAWQFFYLLFFSNTYENISSTGAWIAILTDAGFLLLVIYINGNYFIKAASSLDRVLRSYLLGMNLLLLIYIIWYFLWDVGLNFFPQALQHWFDYPLDIINILFPFACLLSLRLGPQPAPLSFDPGLEDDTCNSALQRVSQDFSLTERETEIMHHVIKGVSNPEIAALLSISPNTVKRHLNNIYRKTNCKNRFQLISLCQASRHK